MRLHCGAASYYALPKPLEWLTCHIGLHHIHPVDKRADIWAFGAVLYEMLTGRRPFEGRDVSEVLGGVLRLDPDWDALPADAPPHLNVFLKRCLEKEPKQRVHDIADVRLAIEGAFETPVAAPTETVVVHRGGWLPWVAGLGLAVVSSLVVWTLTRPEVIPADVVRFTIVPTENTQFGANDGLPALALSLDGTQIVYADAERQLYLRQLDQLDGAPLLGGESGGGPFFSPDGSWVGFHGIDKRRILRKVPILGGAPVMVTESTERYLRRKLGGR